MVPLLKGKDEVTRQRTVAQGLYADLHGVPEKDLRDERKIEELLREACDASDLTAVGQPVVHRFAGGGEGLTGFLLLSESHISVHTYPEIGLLMVDILSCGKTHPREGLSVFERELAHDRIEIRELRRGGDRIG